MEGHVTAWLRLLGTSKPMIHIKSKKEASKKDVEELLCHILFWVGQESSPSKFYSMMQKFECDILNIRIITRGQI